jgi:hypothetical protein
LIAHPALILKKQEAKMKVVLALVALILLFGPGAAATGGAQSCIVKATEALPKIAGLVVKKANTRPMQPEQLANWKGKSKPVIVDLETLVAGSADVYSYICAAGPSGQAFVQRILSQ